MGPLFSLLATQWFVHGSHFPLHYPRWVFFQAMKKICTHWSEQLNNRNHRLKQKKKKCYRCHIVCSLNILIKTCNSIGALSNFNLTERKEKKTCTRKSDGKIHYRFNLQTKLSCNISTPREKNISSRFYHSCFHSGKSFRVTH